MANRTSRRVTRARAVSRTSARSKAARRRNNESVTAWLGELFGGAERRPRTSRSKTSHARSASSKSRTGRKMTRSQAGRAGGLAPHRCRGRECTMKSARSSRSYYR